MLREKSGSRAGEKRGHSRVEKRYLNQLKSGTKEGGGSWEFGLRCGSFGAGILNSLTKGKPTKKKGSRGPDCLGKSLQSVDQPYRGRFDRYRIGLGDGTAACQGLLKL